MLSEPLNEIYGDVHVIQGVVTSTSSPFPGREKEFLLKRGLIDAGTTERSLNQILRNTKKKTSRLERKF